MAFRSEGVNVSASHCSVEGNTDASISMPISPFFDTAMIDAASVCEQLKLKVSGPFSRTGLPISVRPKRHTRGLTAPSTASESAIRSAARVVNDRLRTAVSRIGANSA